jgi:GDP-4-dehydro-6-deoxy-D-mannose reductase
VGSGKARSARWLLETLLTLTPVQVEVKIDPTRLRPSDVPLSVCDNRRLVEATGWQPEIDLHQSLEDLLDGWRREMRGQLAGEKEIL